MNYFRYYVTRHHVYERGTHDWIFISEQIPSDFIKEHCPLVYVDSTGKENHFRYDLTVHIITQKDYEDRNQYSIPLQEFTLKT